MGKRFIWVLAAVGLAVGLTVTGALLWRPAVPQAVPAPSPAAELERSAQRTRERLTRVPNDAQAWAVLGMTQVQLARVTGDPSHHAQAEAAFGESLRLRPSQANEPALTGLAALAAARHEFAIAHAHAEQAVAVDPYSADAHGALADALIELGRYDEGFTAVQNMVDLRPDTGSYARASYTYELRGNTGRARELMDLAVHAAGEPSETAFALQHLAELAFDCGDLPAARAGIDRALRHYPGHTPLLATRAKVAAGQGDLAAAVADLRTVVSRQPFAEYLISLAELLAATGDTAAAKQHAVIRAAAALAGPDADIIVFEAEHGDAGQAVEQARTLYSQRPSIGVADALAWSLHLSGNDPEALIYAEQALRLGTKSALMHYHRGIIHKGLGNLMMARADLETALRLNPAFSLTHSPMARAALTELGATT